MATTAWREAAVATWRSLMAYSLTASAGYPTLGEWTESAGGYHRPEDWREMTQTRWRPGRIPPRERTRRL